jgi:hypothetical protein
MDASQTLFDKLGGRKFVLTLIVIAVATAVQILSPTGVTEAFSALLVGVTGVFGAANAFVTTKAPAVTPDAPEAPPAPDTSHIEEAVEAQAARLQNLEQTTQATGQVLDVLAKRIAAVATMKS